MVHARGVVLVHFTALFKKYLSVLQNKEEEKVSRTARSSVEEINVRKSLEKAKQI